jgi:hypothetical protein
MVKPEPGSGTPHPRCDFVYHNQALLSSDQANKGLDELLGGELYQAMSITRLEYEPSNAIEWDLP